MSSDPWLNLWLACETETELRQLPEYRRQLIERLIGTSHGHGRSTFEHGNGRICAGEAEEHVSARAAALTTIRLMICLNLEGGKPY